MRKSFGAGLREPDHSETCAAQGRIQAQDDLMAAGVQRRAGIKGNGRCPRRTPEAFFHAFELLRRDTHHADDASGNNLSKAENKLRRRELNRSRRGNEALIGFEWSLLTAAAT